MFDSPHSPASFEPMLDSEQAAAIVKVHPKTLQRYARNGIVGGLRVGKLWRFRLSDLHGQLQGAEQAAIDSEAEQGYSVLNHSCPQPSRR
jgi:excisionase family DNA binding protein